MGFIKLKDWEAYVYVKDELKAPDEEALDAAGGSSGVGEANPEEVEELPRDERLEPIVYLDPKIKPTVIVKHYREQYPNVVPGPNGEEEQQNSTGQIDDETDDKSPVGAMRNSIEETDVTKTNGMFVPLVMVAGIVVDDSDVMYMELRSSGILPEIELLIQDEKGLFSTLTTPGVSSTITVSILPTKDGAYKKISLDFVVDSYDEEYDDNDILCLRYFGTYKLNELRVHKNMSVHYIDIPSVAHNLGSHNIFVQPEPTTWEILYHISNNTGLGLATNPDIERLNDHMIRNVQGTYLDELKEIINYGGLNEQHIFEGWVDFYNYLNVVNLAKIFTAELKYNNIVIFSTTKAHTTDKFLSDKELVKVPRVLHNFKESPTQSDMTFNFYKAESDPSDIIYLGASQQCVNMNINGNNLQKQDLQIEENSIDGRHTEDYSTFKFLDVQMDMSSDSFGRDIKLQEKIVKNYKKKINAQNVLLHMQNPNFGLTRGMIVHVSFWVYEPDKKKKILDNMINGVYDESQIKPEDASKLAEIEEINKKIIDDNSKPLLDIKLSGLYYISEMIFEYKKETQQFVQKIKLLKKDRIINLVNKHTAPKVGEGPDVDGGVGDDKNKKNKSGMDNSERTGYAMAKDVGFKIF